MVITVAFTIGDTQKKIVVIDAAHGGADTGVEHDTILEKDIVFRVSEYLKEMSNDNVEFITLRDEDTYVPLNERIEKITSIKPNVVLSLHVAAFPDDRIKGAVAHVYKNELYDNSKQIATQLMTELNNSEILADENIRTSDFYLLKNIKAAPSIIVELGNITNEGDRNFLANSANDKKLAETIAKAFN